MLPLPSWRAAFTYAVPVLDNRSVRVVFGPGSLGTLGAETGALGARALLIAGPHEDDAAAVVSAQLGDALVGRLREVTQHVPAELADDAVDLARRSGVETVVAVGGGSATGLAKAIALQTGLPIVAVPTTYAGSEMTSIWGRSDAAGKTTGRDYRVLPHIVIYDPDLTLTLPAEITAASGMNAIAHALEALYAPDTTDDLSTVAGLALAALAAALPIAVDRPEDLGSRAEAMYGAWLAGWSLGSTTMGLHHKLAHVLGGRYRLPHAGVHSALLPQVAAFNSTAARGAFERAADALDATGPEAVAADLFELADGMGAPTSLAELGLDAGVLAEVADTVLEAEVANPRRVTRPDLLSLLEHAYLGLHP